MPNRLWPARASSWFHKNDPFPPFLTPPWGKYRSRATLDFGINSPLYKPESTPHSLAPMTFVATNWLSISINLLLIVFVIVCLLMTLLVLMQRPKQEGLGAAFGAGVTDQVFGARTTNVLQRGTVYLASLFFILSLTLAVLVGHKNKQKKTVDDSKPAAKVEETKSTKPDESGKPNSLKNEIPIEVKKPEEKPLGTPEVVPPVQTPPADKPADSTSPAPETPASPAAPAPADPSASDSTTSPSGEKSPNL